MEYASDAYKEAMKENVRGESYVWVSLDLVNQFAQDSAYISSQFTGDETNIYNDAVTDVGVTSTESDGSITFTFGEYTTLLLSGVKLELGDPLPSSITITNGIESKTVEVDDSKVMLENDFANCSYIKVTPNTGNLSVIKIMFGCTLDFDHELIMETNRRNHVKHLNDELPLKEFSFTIHNYDRLWNRDNPFGYSRFLQEKQKITFKYGRDIGDEIYIINGGVVYLKNWSSNDFQARFSCVGKLDHTNTEYKKGRFYPDGITLYQLAEFVLQDAGIALYELDAVLRTFIVYNPLPIDTHKACLQMIAHAGRCVLYEDRNGAVCLKSIDRPEILKTATLQDETSFSKGNDVITTTTVANYGSTEPEYTKADGLHYFYPEKEPDEVDTSTDYMPLPSPRVFVGYYDTDMTWKEVNVTNNTITIFGVTFTFNNTNNSIHVTGQNTKPALIGSGYDDFAMLFYYDQNIPIADNDYIFGAAEDINDSIGDKYCSCEIWFNDNDYHAYAQDSFEQREILDKSNIAISEFYVQIGKFSVPLDYTFYPKLYKVIRATEPSNTLPVGFVSEEFAKSDGTFDSTPMISIEFASPSILSEVVLNCAVAPKDFNIKVYLENTLKVTETITDNTLPQVIQEFNNLRCDKVDIIFTKTTPYQRIHVNNVELGAEIDYEITYHDMTSNPVAASIEKLSDLDFEIFKYSDPRDIGVNPGSLGGVNISYSELPSGGLAADIDNADSLSYLHVIPGLNYIELDGVCLVESVEYSDEIEGGNVTIAESGAYYVIADASREGDITIHGFQYIESITDYIISVNEIGNPIKVSNPLISTKEHADRLKDWFLDYYNNDIEYTLSYRGDPILDADDTIYIENQFVEDNFVRIETEEISTSGGMNTNNQLIARRISYGAAKPDPLVATDFELNTTEIQDLAIGDTAIITVPVWQPITARDRDVTFVSADPNIATITASGVVTGISEGITTVTVTHGNIVHTCIVKVVVDPSLLVSDFTLSDTQLSLEEGDTYQLSVIEWIPENAINKSVTWTSSDSTVATIDSNGLVTAISTGNAIITATTSNGVSRTCTVSSNYVAVTDFILESSSIDITSRELVTVKVVEWIPSNATNKSYSLTSSDESIVRVWNNTIIGVSSGTANITVTCADGISHTISVTSYNTQSIISTPYTDGTVTRSGITYTLNGSDIYSNGTATSNSYFRVKSNMTLSPGKYYLYGVNNKNIYHQIIGENIDLKWYDDYESRIFTISSSINIAFYLYVKEGYTARNTSSNPTTHGLFRLSN